jgi:glycosyltransferase involved in cell wall biosynthesis
MKLNIAILGTRGIPNYYGGFEQITGYLAQGLVEKGHTVSVYNSHNHPYTKKEWNGVQIIHRFDPEFMMGGAGQFIYDLNCIMDARKRHFDIILMLGYTSSSIWRKIYPKKPVIIYNMDGLEFERTKYSQQVQKFLKYAEKQAVLSTPFLIADSLMIKKYLDEKYRIQAKYIGYGADLCGDAAENLLQEYGLEKNQYFLLMARMERENNIEMVLDGFLLSNSNKKFIVIGNTQNGYGKFLLHKYRNEARIIFLGPLFEPLKVKSIVHFSNLYFHGHSVGGTNPSLLEAMAAEAMIAAHSNQFNKCILEENALYFSNEGEVGKIIDANEHTEKNETFILNNYTTIQHEFNWEKIIGQYDDYFQECFRSRL